MPRQAPPRPAVYRLLHLKVTKVAAPAPTHPPCLVSTPPSKAPETPPPLPHRKQGWKPGAVKYGEHHPLPLLVHRFGCIDHHSSVLVCRAEHGVRKGDDDHGEAANKGGLRSCGGLERVRLRPEADGVASADLSNGDWGGWGH